MQSPICPSCKSIVEIPPDHFDATIRCGICWAEVIVERPPVEVRDEFVEEIVETPKAVTNPFATIPGRAAKGMEPLEGLLAGVVAKLPHLYTAPEVVAIDEPVATEPVRKRVVAKRREDDGLRRKRGIASGVQTREEPEPATTSVAKLVLLLLVAVVVAIAGYFVMR